MAELVHTIRAVDGDLIENLAVRRDHDKIRGTSGAAFGVEAESRDVDVAVGTDSDAFGTALYPGLPWALADEIWQNGQDLNVALIPCASRCEGGRRGPNSAELPLTVRPRVAHFCHAKSLAVAAVLQHSGTVCSPDSFPVFADTTSG